MCDWQASKVLRSAPMPERVPSIASSAPWSVFSDTLMHIRPLSNFVVRCRFADISIGPHSMMMRLAQQA